MGKRTVVGRRSVEELLKVRPQSVDRIYLSENFESKKWAGEFKHLFKKTRAQVVHKKESFFDKLSFNSQGIACESHESPEWPEGLEQRDKALILALDSVEDPQNLGAILRTSWLMGVDGILIPQKSSSSLTPTVYKIASGGGEHVPVLRVKNLKSEIQELKEQGFWSYALAVDSTAQPVDQVVKSQKTIVIAGAEEKGIGRTLLDDSDFKVYLPQKDPKASYNVSVSVALALWTLSR